MNLLCPSRFLYLMSLILGKGWKIQQDKIQNTNATLSMKLSLVVHLVWLIMGALTSKGPTSLCQLAAMSSTVWPINIWGGIGSTFYGEDGQVLYSSLPTYGQGKEAGNEAGYIVGMSTCYPQPGCVKINDRRL
ncbi:hypothetical protein SO802_019930 [Lithocarpus litseifolius]|uniref:Uncharacterized protein n=1 Tax=Lithocarpus litseifolius TaxID=425828 RepID=A0AAW2CAI3_9ROSI